MAHYRAELTGVFGDPVDDNPTCVLEEAAYAALGLNYRYLTMKVLPEDLETAMAAVKALNFRGINLTMPHKIKVIPLLDELSEAAQIIGAVNTVINDNGKLTGENTDGKGFTTSLKNNNVKISGSKIMILGAGGAARAIAVECALNGAQHIYIVNRTQVSGNELARLINEKTTCSAEFVPWTENLAVPEGTDILINATPIGFTPNQMHRPDIDYDTIRKGMAAADVVFDPIDTLFLEECEKHGARCFNGIGMLVQQGALNFTLWTGEEAPVDVMYDALEKEIRG
ncbi:MAG: shikimate dehydrogenase [Lachnospiraceae bacterium]|nr:shikimate dehydrogenase [Lachnospiraceae bacterium]